MSDLLIREARAGEPSLVSHFYFKLFEGQLRLFGTDTDLQGTGAGTMLLETAMAFCREKEYTHVFLWTIDICQAACHLYEKFGFVMTDTKPNTTWADYEMLEEKWEYQRSTV